MSETLNWMKFGLDILKFICSNWKIVIPLYLALSGSLLMTSSAAKQDTNMLQDQITQMAPLLGNTNECPKCKKCPTIDCRNQPYR